MTNQQQLGSAGINNEEGICEARCRKGRVKSLMVWSAAGKLLGDSPPGNEFVSHPATPPVALSGERRAAPPGTRLRKTCASSMRQKGGDGDLKGDLIWNYTR